MSLGADPIPEAEPLNEAALLALLVLICIGSDGKSREFFCGVDPRRLRSSISLYRIVRKRKRKCLQEALLAKNEVRVEVLKYSAGPAAI